LNLKSFLKTLKLNESTISMALGAFVIIVVAVLVVNYFRNLSSGSILPNAPQVQNGETQKHTVGRGETLWSISQKYYQTGYNWTEIAKANDIENPNSIEVGQELIIPKIQDEKEAVKDEAGETENSQNSIVSASYVVQKEDNLWSIAIRAYGDGYKWVEIARENSLVNPDLIHTGNKLVLPR